MWLSCSCLCLALALVAPAAGAQQAPIRLTQLHDALRLSPEQEDAWRSYTAAVATSPQADARHRVTQQMLPKLATPRRIALLNAAMDQDLADMRRQGEAVLAFYGRLKPEQQAVFDRQTLQADENTAPGN